MSSCRSTRIPAPSALIAVAQLALALGAVAVLAADPPSMTLRPEAPDQDSIPCVGDGDGNGQVQVDEIVEAVRNALAGCPGTDLVRLHLTLRVVRAEDGSELRVVAELRHGGGATVTYLGGCSALCRPALYEPIYFTVIGPTGAEVFIERPCGGPLFCSPWSTELAPGDHLEEELRVTGTQWKQEGADLFTYCGECTEQPLPGGRYIVVARFLYSTDLVQGYPPPQQVIALTEFTWP